MKRFLPALVAVFLGFTTQAQDQLKHDLEFSYNSGIFGQSIHLNYGLHNDKDRIYIGLRHQLHDYYNLLNPDMPVNYRYSTDGIPLGLNLGYERRFNLKHSAVKPLLGFGSQLTYLNSRYEVIYVTTGETLMEPGPSYFRFSTSLYTGFETQLYKNVILKPTFGVSALWEPKLYVFNGLGVEGNLSLIYRF